MNACFDFPRSFSTSLHLAMLLTASMVIAPACSHIRPKTETANPKAEAVSPKAETATPKTAVPTTQWKAGAAKTVITPTEAIRMGGFAFRKHVSEGVRHDIYAKALALQDDTGKTFVVLSAELVGVHRDIWDRIAERCEKQYGISRECLVMNESHSHSAPLARLNPSGTASDVPPEEEAVVHKYALRVIDQAVEVVGQAIQRLQPANVAYGHGLAGIAVNRRRTETFGGIPGGFPGGPVDHDVPVLKVSDLDGKLLAVLVGYACHTSVLMDYQISGDWAGYAQEYIEKAHPDTVALFMQGCAGDSYAYPRKTVELAQLYGRKLAAATEDVLNEKSPQRPMVKLSGPIHAAFAYAELPVKMPLPTRDELNKMKDSSDMLVARHAAHLLKLLDRDGKLIDRYPEPVQVWRFGSDLTFIALGGEVVVDYARRLKNQYGWDTTWVSGYSNDNFGYVPSLRVLNEGGYEGGDSMLFKDIPGPFATSVEDILIEKINDLVKQTSK